MLENEIISWQAPEYIFQPKEISWKWVSLIAAIILIVFGIWQKNPLFIFFIIIALLLLNYFVGQFPKIWQFKISEKGVSVGMPDKESIGKFYPFEEIESFDIHLVGEEYKELILKLKSRFTPYLKINIHISDEEKISNFLEKLIPREEYNPSLVVVF